MHIIAATFLLPVGVIIYTSIGGIKATFLTDYFHTFVILIIACYFTVKAFSIPEIGSPSGLYDLVIAAGERHPVSGNHDGSYMTMTSKGVSHVQPQYQKRLITRRRQSFSALFISLPTLASSSWTRVSLSKHLALPPVPWFQATLSVASHTLRSHGVWGP